ncbi:MAG TPA: GNAT family N-acetyltransferase [Flavisolibacter sp.]|jgi:ribosomal protein S18 acetylase RimI-like enzyme
MNRIIITDYQPVHQPHFETLNRQWIEKHFFLEEIDRYVLSHPGEAILDKGGAILMALYDGEVAGTVALKKAGSDVYEFTKMAVYETFRRRGIAEALSQAAFEKAAQLGAGKIILYTQSGLQPAILLYKKLGFRQVPLEPGVYQRADVKMEIDLPVKTMEYEHQAGAGNGGTR